MRFLAFVPVVLWAFSARSAEIRLQVEGAPASGTLVFQVYDSPNSFGDFRNPANEMRTLVREDNEYVITDVATGEVAVLVYIDENGNGLIDKNFIGIPKEPLGISNNYRPKGPPAFRRAALTVAEGELATIRIEIRKVLGEYGRLGIGAGVVGRGSPYTGSATTVLQPIPAITYNGERLQWLGPNLQYGLLGTGRWRIAASASYRIGAYEENDSPALAGLGDRENTLMAGIGFRYELPAGLNLLVRYEHDVLGRIGGGEAAARLSKGFQAGWMRLTPQVQANWQSADVANYDFGVPQSGSTLTRPEYIIGSSFSYEVGFGSFIELTQEWRIIVNLSVEFLPGKITESPIVADDHVVKGFAAVTYVF